MNENDIKTVLKSAGFTKESSRTSAIHKNDISIFEYAGEFKHGSVLINDFDLYVSDFEYLKIELNDDSIVVRFYYDYHYIGCNVTLFEELRSFDIKKFGEF